MKNEKRITRTTPSLTKGLSNEQVEERKKLGLVNKTRVVVGKTYLEIILTGQDPSQELMNLADYVSEIRKIKHPFDQGIHARLGIEK